MAAHTRIWSLATLALPAFAASCHRPATGPAGSGWDQPAVVAAAKDLPVAASARIVPWGHARSTSILLARSSGWRVGPTSEAPAGWQERGFDDSTWPLGRPSRRPAPGLGGPHATPATTHAAPGTPTPAPTVVGRFRRSFNLIDERAYPTVVMRLPRAEGVTVHLNGRELARDTRVAAPPGIHPAPPFVCIPPDLLVRGRNVIAVEVTRRPSDNLPDPLFDLDMVAGEGPSLVRGPYLQVGTTTSAVVRWRTDCPTDSLLAVGASAGQVQRQLRSPTPTTEHEVTVDGLAPDTRYHYAVGMSEATGARWVAGGDEATHFVTAPAAPKPTRIWVLGDPGTRDDRAAAVRDAYAAYTGARRTDVWLMLGDNAYDRGLDTEFQAAVFDMYPGFLRNTFLWSVVGNHETNQRHEVAQVEAAPYFRLHTFPTKGEAGGTPSGTERYYSFDWSDIHFVALDSMTTSTERDKNARTYPAAMLSWLEADLGARNQPWTIVFFHHPPYTKGTHDSDNFNADYESFLVRRQINPILEKHGVDLVLSGHSHVYERSFLIAGHTGTSDTFTADMKKHPGDGRPGGTGAFVRQPGAKDPGTVYVVAGSSGQTSSSAKLNHPAMFVSFPKMGSLVIDAQGGRLDVKFLRETGMVDDHFTMVRGPVKDHLPKVTITSPEAGEVKGQVKITATAEDDRKVTRVDFYRHPRILIGTDAAAPYEVTTTFPPGADQQITAVATDDAGQEAMGVPVRVKVVE